MARRALIIIMIEGLRSSLRYAQAAQRLGLHPIVLSEDPSRYEHLAGKEGGAIRVETDNLDALIRECSRLRATHDIAGITSASESAYETVGTLCQHFDLPGPNPAAIKQRCDKFTQRQLLAKAGVPIPAYRLAANSMDIERAAAEIGLPVVVKPCVGSGSVGVRLCRTINELAEHTNYLLGEKHMWRSSPRILIEEFVHGPQYMAETIGNELIGIGTMDFGPPPAFRLS